MAQLLVGFGRDVGYPREAADRPQPLEVLLCRVRDAPQFFRRKHERVCPGQEQPRHVGRVAAQLTQVRLDFFRRGQAEFERNVVIERAEFALVVRAARRDLQQRGPRLVRRSPDRAGVVHVIPPKMSFWCF